MIGKRLINTGVAAAGALVPSEHFETVTYTGNGGTQRIGGYINRGGLFNGSSSKIEVQGITGMGANDFTYSCWFYTNSTAASNFNILTPYTADHLFYGIQIYSTTIGAYGLNASAGGEYIISNSGTITTGTWYHVAYVKSSTAGHILYLNGSVVASDSNFTGNMYSAAGYNSLWIGSNENIQYFNGKIDQIRVFNKALSSGEVSTLYGETYASSTVSTTDIFNDDSAIALYQLDGNANDTGGVSGKFGSAAIFNGSSSGIDLPSNVPVANQINTSVSLWFKVLNNSKKETLVRFANNDEVLFRINTNGTLDLIGTRQGDNTYISYTTTGSYNNGVWHNLIMTRETNSIKFYINGTLDNTLSWNNTFVTASNETAIGYDGFSSSSVLTGSIDDVRIYSDVLTSTEVGYIYNNTTASIPTDNLVAYYKLDGDARDEQQLYDGTATNVSYAYNGTATNVTYQEATKFQPDLVWIKHRSGATNHQLYDSNRGGSFALTPNLSDPDYDAGAAGLTFNTNGFTINNGYSNHNGLNETYAAWTWKAGGTAVSNTDGTIPSTVSANPDAGFSIVKFTSPSTNTTGFTIGHGLSSTPDLIITKPLDAAVGWHVYSSAFSTPSQSYLQLQLSDAALTGNTNIWNNTAATSTVFSMKTGYAVGTSSQTIAYCFHSVEGFSKIGSYTGTGVSGNVSVITGFEPAMIIAKRTDAGSSNWFIWDNKRDTTNPNGAYLLPNASNSENNLDAYAMNFLENGFTVNSSDPQLNANGGTYIYLAIAADPDTTTPVVENSFDVVTYTGTSSTQSISTDFKPDLVWIKSRSNASWHSLQDSIRGATKTLFSNTTNAEITYSDAQTSFDTNGFTLGADVSGGSVNVSGRTYVAWVFKAGDHDDNLPQINTEGTIDSIVSVNAAAGFSIVKYNSATTPSTNFTIGHGLSSTPEMIITKVTSTGGDWYVWNKDLSNISTNYLRLNASDAEATLANMWGTGHTATTIGLRTSASASTNHSHVAYCFHSVSGYQKVGSYSGTGANGNSITTGFQPRWLLVKRTNTADNWVIVDSIRGVNGSLFPDDTSQELSNSGAVTFNSNGFTVNGASGGWNNGTSTYIYLAIA